MIVLELFLCMILVFISVMVVFALCVILAAAAKSIAEFIRPYVPNMFSLEGKFWEKLLAVIVGGYLLFLWIAASWEICKWMANG